MLERERALGGLGKCLRRVEALALGEYASVLGPAGLARVEAWRPDKLHERLLTERIDAKGLVFDNRLVSCPQFVPRGGRADRCRARKAVQQELAVPGRIELFVSLWVMADPQDLDSQMGP